MSSKNNISEEEKNNCKVQDTEQDKNTATPNVTSEAEDAETTTKSTSVATNNSSNEENEPAEINETELLKKENAELKNKLIYLQADYQNYRKRTIKDLADARIYGASSTLSPFLTVFDYLNLARTASEKSDNIESIRQGLNLIIAEFYKAFDELNVKKLDSVGMKFNPELHEAVAHEPSDTIPEGEIIKEWTSGFKMGDRLLRAARVVVSAGSANFQADDSDKMDKKE